MHWIYTEAMTHPILCHTARVFVCRVCVVYALSIKRPQLPTLGEPCDERRMKVTSTAVLVAILCCTTTPVVTSEEKPGVALLV